MNPHARSRQLLPSKKGEYVKSSSQKRLSEKTGWKFVNLEVSFALVSQICVRRDALTLFGLNDDELLPDLHITGAGVLRTGLGAHQEHRVNDDAQAADRTKVPAEAIQVAAHEVDRVGRGNQWL